MKYLIREIETTRPVPDILVPDDYDGVACVLRTEDKPSGFFMKPLNRQHVLPREEVARLVKQSLYVAAGAEKRAPASSFPSLTVAVCTKDRAAKLRRCLASICRLQAPAAGTATLFEIVVVDNAPSDESTRRVVSEFPTVSYASERKPGLDFARNRAIEVAGGDLLAFADDDVVLDRAWLDGLKTAWCENPDAGAFTGPVLPLELSTKAQIMFEARGGFGHSFCKRRFSRAVHPFKCGLLGCGCNMAFRTNVLRELGGFDEALDTGAPLPGGGDLDIFFRVLAAGYPLAYEPEFLVYHEDRVEYAALRHQMWTWGLAVMAYAAKSWRNCPPHRRKLRHSITKWFLKKSGKVLVCSLGFNHYLWSPGLALAELAGGVVGLLGEYRRSEKRIVRIRKAYSCH